VINVLRVTPALVVILLLPGVAVATGLRPAAGLVRNLAIAPAVSFGLLMAVALGSDGVGVPVRWWTLLPVTYALVASVVSYGVARRPAPADRQLTAPRTRLDRLEWLVLLAVVVGALAVWLHASHFGASVPPNDDGTHHGLFTARILRLGSVDPARTSVGDVLSGHPAVRYYPFGLHLVAAMVAAVSGVGVGVAVDAVAIVAAAAVLPLGVFVLTRRVLPVPRRAAVAAAAFAVAFPAFPYYVSYWGGLTMIVGVALVPAVADAAAGAGADGALLRCGLLLGLAFTGVFEVHNTEVVTVAVVVAALVLLPLRRETFRRLGRLALAWLAGAVVSLAVALPQASLLAANAGERVNAARLKPVSPATAWGDAVTTFVGFGSASRGLIAVLAIVGMAEAARRRAAGWLLGAAVFVGLTYLSARRTGVGDALTSAWYTRWDRVVIDEIYFVAAFAGLGLVVVATWLAAAGRRLRVARPVLPRREALPNLAAGAAVVAVVVVGLVPQWRADRAELRLAFSDASNVGDGQRAAFGWLARHVSPGQRVLNDVTQDTAWMYADSGVAPLFAMAVHAFPTSDWGDRVYLLDHAGSLGSAPEVTRVADEWNVRWAIVSSKLFPYRTTTLTARRLSSAPGWRLVFHAGTAWVFERVR